MAGKTIYTLSEPVGETYHKLISISLAHADTLLLATMHSQPLGPSAIDLLETLRPFTIRKTEEKQWPGTTLHNHTATVYRVRFSPEVADIMLEAADRLFNWLQPGLPEDPCLLRADGTPWLATISHERDAFIELTVDESEALRASVPRLSLAPEG